jgi:hypothetical protein
MYLNSCKNVDNDLFQSNIDLDDCMDSSMF